MVVGISHLYGLVRNTIFNFCQKIIPIHLFGTLFLLIFDLNCNLYLYSEHKSSKIDYRSKILKSMSLENVKNYKRVESNKRIAGEKSGNLIRVWYQIRACWWENEPLINKRVHTFI